MKAVRFRFGSIKNFRWIGISFCPPLTESYLREQKFTPSAVYELPFKITIENKLRSFQFKLIHNILPTNQRLWKMNVKSSPKCEQCDAPCETISHMFYECPAVKIFWEKVIEWWNRKRSFFWLLASTGDIFFLYCCVFCHCYHQVISQALRNKKCCYLEKSAHIFEVVYHDAVLCKEARR